MTCVRRRNRRSAALLSPFYIADRTTNQIVKVNPPGNATILNFSSVGALSNPEGVAVDPSGNVYVMDSSNQRIIRLTTSRAIAVMPFSGVTLGSFIFGITLDSNGNVLVADWSNNRLVKVNVGQSALTFANTNVGATSRDSPKTTTVTDLGDQPLAFSVNPTYTTNFSENTGDTNLCTSTTSLSPGTGCDVSLNFTPQTADSLSANITVTNNTLNVAASTQQVSVSGTGIQTADTTATTVSINPTSAVLGQSIAITAVVTDTTTGHTATIPTGGVTFMDTIGSTSVSLNSGNAVTLNGAGQAVLSGVTLSGAGTHTITASYSGVTDSFQTSSNTTIIQIAATTATTTTLSIAPGESVITGTAVTFTATVAPAPTGTPAGTVSFYNGTTLLGTGTVDSSGVATFISSSLPTGVLSLTAVYSGNAGSAASTSSAVSETVAATYTLTASSAPVTVTPGGTATFSIEVPPVGGAFNNVVTLSATGLPPGASATFNPPTVTPGTPELRL